MAVHNSQVQSLLSVPLCTYTELHLDHLHEQTDRRAISHASQPDPKWHQTQYPLLGMKLTETKAIPSQSLPLTVSYMCHLQSSSDIFPKAALIPPWKKNKNSSNSFGSNNKILVQPEVEKGNQQQQQVQIRNVSKTQSKQANLCSDGVRTSGEELGDTSGTESTLRQTDGCPQPCSSSSHHNGIIRVVYYRIGRAFTPRRRRRRQGSGCHQQRRLMMRLRPYLFPHSPQHF